jgi:hypothetical protein
VTIEPADRFTDTFGARPFGTLGGVMVRDLATSRAGDGSRSFSDVTASIALVTAIVIAIAAPASPAAAGPWTPEPGDGYLKLWLKYLVGFDYRAGDGSTYGYGFYNELFLNAYGEVGLAPGLAAYAHWPFVQTFVLQDPTPYAGGIHDHTVVGDPTLGLRWRFLRIGRFVSAIEAGVRFPFAPGGEQQPMVAGASSGYRTIGALRVGTGVWDFPASLSIGYGWDAFYLAASGGWVARTDDFDHVLTWSAEGGGTFSSGLSLRARVVGWHSVGNGDPRRYHESPSGIGSGTSYIGFAIEMDYPLVRGWWIGTTFEGGIAALSRQTGGPVISLYVATRFSTSGTR